MQISRHWRLNAQRYRLEGTRHENGNVNLQERQSMIFADDATPNDTDETRETPAVKTVNHPNTVVAA